MFILLYYATSNIHLLNNLLAYLVKANVEKHVKAFKCFINQPIITRRASLKIKTGFQSSFYDIVDTANLNTVDLIFLAVRKVI